MTVALLLLSLQGVLGAFDNIWNHEWREQLPSRPGARRELFLHAVRGALYAPVFLSFGWIAWQGAWAWVFIALLAVELGITLADFVEEDRSRKLSRLERLTHTVLTLNYGAFLALAAPELVAGALRPTGAAILDHGWVSWLMTVYAAGSFGFAVREALATRHLARAWPMPVAAATSSGRSVLVTGGSGFIGRAVTRRLLERGDRVTVLSRDPRRARHVLGPLPAIVSGFEAIPESERIDAVINLAGAPIFGRPWTKARKRILAASRIGVTRDLVVWMAGRAQRPEALVSASAVGWYGAGEGRRDEAAPAGGDFPAALCKAWEREAAQAVSLGIRVCRLRLGLVLGRDGGLLKALLPAYQLGLGARFGSGAQWVSWIHLDDAVELIVRASVDPLFWGAINATAPTAVTQAEFAHSLAKALDRTARLKVPAWILRAGLGEMSSLLLKGQRVTPRRALEIGFAFRWHEIKPAFHDLIDCGAPRSGATVRLMDNLLT